jgi:hypothetical protein
MRIPPTIASVKKLDWIAFLNSHIPALIILFDEKNNIPEFDLCPGHTQIKIAVLPLTVDTYLY